jgi:hypothetical protein
MTLPTFEIWKCCGCNKTNTCIDEEKRRSDIHPQRCVSCNIYRPQATKCMSCDYEIKLSNSKTCKFIQSNLLTSVREEGKEKKKKEEKCQLLTIFCPSCESTSPICEIYNCSRSKHEKIKKKKREKKRERKLIDQALDKALINLVKDRSAVEHEKELKQKPKVKMTKEELGSQLEKFQEKLKKEVDEKIKLDKERRQYKRRLEEKKERDEKQEKEEKKRSIPLRELYFTEFNSPEIDKQNLLMTEDIRYGRIEQVRQHLKNGLLPLTKGKGLHGKTMLMIAIEYNQPEIFHLLFEHGADEYSTDNWGKELQEYIFDNNNFLIKFRDIVKNNNSRLVAFLMGKKTRLVDENSAINKFFNDPLFDPNIINVLGKFVKPINFVC